MSGVPPLAGEVALVTGASKGIGAAIAARLGELGARVETAERATGFDLRDPASAQAAIGRLDRLDILVCNAGTALRRPLLETSLADWEDAIALNLTAPFLLSQAAARRFLVQGPGGRIVHVASLRSFVAGDTETATYSTTKAGLVQLMHAQASEWASLGIRVNAVAPGWVQTNLTTGMRDEQRARITQRIATGRWATPEEVADAVGFLVSPQSRGIHGHTLVVDGGYLTR